jgi:hypothetical protein
MGEAVTRIIFSVLPFVDRVSYSVFPGLYSWQEVNVHLESFRSLLVMTRVWQNLEILRRNLAFLSVISTLK